MADGIVPLLWPAKQVLHLRRSFRAIANGEVGPKAAAKFEEAAAGKGRSRR